MATTLSRLPPLCKIISTIKWPVPTTCSSKRKSGSPAKIMSLSRSLLTSAKIYIVQVTSKGTFLVAWSLVSTRLRNYLGRRMQDLKDAQESCQEGQTVRIYAVMEAAPKMWIISLQEMTQFISAWLISSRCLPKPLHLATPPKFRMQQRTIRWPCRHSTLTRSDLTSRTRTTIRVQTIPELLRAILRLRSIERLMTVRPRRWESSST